MEPEFNLGANLEDLRERVFGGLVIPQVEKCEKNHSIMELTRLDSLFSEPDETTHWLVDGLLPSGGFSVLVAKPKVGKSTLARWLALCVAQGKPFLGKDVNSGVVIYLALEEKRAEIKRHFLDMGATGSEEIHVYSGGTPADAIRQIRAAVEKLNPLLLIIDPLFRLTKVKDGNDYIQVTNALDPLLRIARELKTHVQCIHHSPKRDSCQGGDDVLGSTAIFGSVDTLMVMKRQENYRTLQTIQRYGTDMEETVLEFNRSKRVVTIGGSRHETDMDILGKAILDFLSKQKEPVIEKVITDEVIGRTTLKRQALRELLEKEEIMRIGKGGKGDSFRYSCPPNACSQEMLVPDVGNESGTSKNEQNNYLEKNACSRVPDICGEQQKKECKKPATPHGCKGNACSRVPVFPCSRKQKKIVGNKHF